MNILFLIIAFFSEVVGTVGGFGSSVFFVPLAGLFFDFHTVLLLTSVLHVFSNISKLVLFYKGINYRLLLLIGLPSLIFVIIGAYLSTILFSVYTELFLGIFLVLFSIFFFVKPDFKLNTNNSTAIAGGSTAGFLAGIIGTGGAIRGLSLAAFNLEKNAFVATSAAIDFGVDLSRGIIYFSTSTLSKEYYFMIPFLLLIAVFGSYIGKIILNKISQSQFRSIVLGLILIIGITMISKIIF